MMLRKRKPISNLDCLEQNFKVKSITRQKFQVLELYSVVSFPL
ncbi:mCG147747 [Mus musculus]|nr:mCG147747 [Mus musculus]